MTYREAFESGADFLSEAGIVESSLDAFWLFSYVTGIDRGRYLLQKNEPMEAERLNAYAALLKRRAAHEPCQYLTGSTQFWGLEFRVSPEVLIPRQDTEVLVEEALKEAAVLKEKGRTPLKILDMCTGSGAIAVALACEMPEAEVTAADISPDALKIARENAAQNRAAVSFMESNLFAALDPERRFDLLVSNPPYVTEQEYEDLMPEVRLHEPAIALLAGADGLDFYRAICREAGRYLSPGGRILFEIGYAQARDVSGLLEENGFTAVQTVKDLSGLDRVVKAVLA